MALCLPRSTEWDIYEAGTQSVTLDHHELSLAFGGAETALEFDARARTYAGHRTITSDGHNVRLVPVRFGTKAIGLLAAAGRPVEPGTLDALAGVVAIAVERAQFLEERKAAELARQSEELKSALLASLGHDLKTPLTAIRVAATNLKATWLGDTERRDCPDRCAPRPCATPSAHLGTSRRPISPRRRGRRRRVVPAHSHTAATRARPHGPADERRRARDFPGDLS